MSLTASLLELPQSEARALLASGVPVFLAINPVEYHGPHLSLRNDALVTAGLVRDLHARLAKNHPDWPLVTAGELEIGVDPTPGIGSRHTTFPVACEVVREACRALHELGAKRVVLMTFHGAPLHNLAIQAGVETLQTLGVRALAPFNLVLRELLHVESSQYAEAFSHIEDTEERAGMQRDLHLDFHGGFFETSMTLHYAPQSVSSIYKSLPPCPAVAPNAAMLRAAGFARSAGARTLAAEMKLAAFGMGWHALAPFPGYTGRPHRSSASAGAVFARHIVGRYDAIAEDVLAGRVESPRPIMAWMGPLTARGLLSPKFPQAETYVPQPHS